MTIYVLPQNQQRKDTLRTHFLALGGDLNNGDALITQLAKCFFDKQNQ